MLDAASARAACSVGRKAVDVAATASRALHSRTCPDWARFTKGCRASGPERDVRAQRRAMIDERARAFPEFVRFEVETPDGELTLSFYSFAERFDVHYGRRRSSGITRKGFGATASLQTASRASIILTQAKKTTRLFVSSSRPHFLTAPCPLRSRSSTARFGPSTPTLCLPRAASCRAASTGDVLCCPMPSAIASALSARLRHSPEGRRAHEGNGGGEASSAKSL